MDPQACLDRLAAAVMTSDFPEAVAALNDYYRWRLKGGFEPGFCGTRGLPGDEYADTLANALADKIGAE